MKVSIGKAAKELGVSRDTLRKWEAEGKITVDRAANGRRRYDIEDLNDIAPKDTVSARLTIGYGRVVDSDQRDYLDRQVALIESFCSINSWWCSVITDEGSGVNFRNPGLRELINRICGGDVDRLVLTSVSRLPRLGADLIFSLCERFGVEIVILNASPELEPQEELSSDVIEIISLFCARLYDESHAGGDVVSKLRALADDLDMNRI